MSMILEPMRYSPWLFENVVTFMFWSFFINFPQRIHLKDPSTQWRVMRWLPQSECRFGKIHETSFQVQEALWARSLLYERLHWLQCLVDLHIYIRAQTEWECMVTHFPRTFWGWWVPRFAGGKVSGDGDNSRFLLVEAMPKISYRAVNVNLTCQ